MSSAVDQLPVSSSDSALNAIIATADHHRSAMASSPSQRQPLPLPFASARPSGASGPEEVSLVAPLQTSAPTDSSSHTPVKPLIRTNTPYSPLQPSRVASSVAFASVARDAMPSPASMIARAPTGGSATTTPLKHSTYTHCPYGTPSHCNHATSSSNSNTSAATVTTAFTSQQELELELLQHSGRAGAAAPSLVSAAPPCGPVGVAGMSAGAGVATVHVVVPPPHHRRSACTPIREVSATPLQLSTISSAAASAAPGGGGSAASTHPLHSQQQQFHQWASSSMTLSPATCNSGFANGGAQSHQHQRAYHGHGHQPPFQQQANQQQHRRPNTAIHVSSSHMPSATASLPQVHFPALLSSHPQSPYRHPSGTQHNAHPSGKGGSSSMPQSPPMPLASHPSYAPPVSSTASTSCGTPLLQYHHYLHRSSVAAPPQLAAPAAWQTVTVGSLGPSSQPMPFHTSSPSPHAHLQQQQHLHGGNGATPTCCRQPSAASSLSATPSHVTNAPPPQSAPVVVVGRHVTTAPTGTACIATASSAVNVQGVSGLPIDDGERELSLSPVAGASFTAFHAALDRSASFAGRGGHSASSPTPCAAPIVFVTAADLPGFDPALAHDGVACPPDQCMDPADSPHLQTRLQQRKKQINIGRDTEGYRQYTSHVPREDREHLFEFHPVTPRHDFDCSKRQFDAAISAWRRALHKWDDFADLDPAEAASRLTSGGACRKIRDIVQEALEAKRKVPFCTPPSHGRGGGATRQPSTSPSQVQGAGSSCSTTPGVGHSASHSPIEAVARLSSPGTSTPQSAAQIAQDWPRTTSRSAPPAHATAAAGGDCGGFMSDMAPIMVPSPLVGKLSSSSAAIKVVSKPHSRGVTPPQSAAPPSAGRDGTSV